jgi:hypothetical protein
MSGGARQQAALRAEAGFYTARPLTGNYTWSGVRHFVCCRCAFVPAGSKSKREARIIQITRIKVQITQRSSWSDPLN